MPFSSRSGMTASFRVLLRLEGHGGGSLGVLIRSYGEHWNPDFVDWGRPGRGTKGSLNGFIGGVRNPVYVNVWNQRGIYLLHHEWEVVYVGRASERALGNRLRGHLTDSLAGRWDTFSWFGTRGVTQRGVLSRIGERKNVSALDAIATLEAMLIAVAAHGRNRRRERFQVSASNTGGAENPRPLRSYLEEIRGGMRELRLAERLDDIEQSLA